MLSASWMAVSACSVASLLLLGIFAISVVASSLRRTVAAARTVRIDRGIAPRKRHPLRLPTPPTSPIYRPAFILSSWQHERNNAGKDFLIIVNRLLTIANHPTVRS